MKLWARINDMPTKTKRIVAAGLAVALAAAGIWAVSRLGRDDEPRGQARATSMSDMEGMDMGGNGTVHLTADQIRTFGVTFGTVEWRTLTEDVRTVGIVNFDETRMAAVTPKFSGYIERLYVDFTGKPVRSGQPLVEIYSPELVAAQEELLLAARLERNLSGSAVPGVPAGSSNLVAAAKQRLRLWDISDAQIDQILRSGRARRTLTLYAPVSGVVVEKNVLAGQAVQAGAHLYTIADLSEVWVEAELREADAAYVDVGDAVRVEFAAFPARPISGRVEYIYPTLQQKARTLKARIAIPNPGGRLKPGMYATVRLAAPQRTALTVPASALVRTGERALVFVEVGGGRIRPQEVQVGRIAGDLAEVLTGAEAGQRVVTSAQFLIDSESNLAEVMKSMIGQMNMSDMGGMDMGGMKEMEQPGADMRGMQMPGKER
ncbi:MAG: efflux RND transporter periplasmic adaptor subunit [Gemmatimonadota bacterium]